jgi:hypothetical protein
MRSAGWSSWRSPRGSREATGSASWGGRSASTSRSTRARPRTSVLPCCCSSSVASSGWSSLPTPSHRSRRCRDVAGGRGEFLFCGRCAARAGVARTVPCARGRTTAGRARIQAPAISTVRSVVRWSGCGRRQSSRCARRRAGAAARRGSSGLQGARSKGRVLIKSRLVTTICIIDVGFGPLCRLKSNISRGPRSAMCGRLRVGKAFLHVCRLVGAAMCSAC